MQVVPTDLLKEVEGLGLKSHGVAAVGQFATVGVKSIVVEEIAHSRFRWEAAGLALYGSTPVGSKKTSWP